MSGSGHGRAIAEPLLCGLFGDVQRRTDERPRKALGSADDHLIADLPLEQCSNVRESREIAQRGAVAGRSGDGVEILDRPERGGDAVFVGHNVKDS